MAGQGTPVVSTVGGGVVSDPAEVAANRVAQQVTHQIYYHHMLDAAREALKPLRELHRPLDRPISWGNTQTERVCHHCLGPVKWPCLTARLVYSSEELS